MKKLTVLFFTIFCTSIVIAQNRVDHPLQVQGNLSGAFLAAFGKTISNPEIESFKVSNWVLPGISAGYHINRWLYAGMSLTPNRSIEMKEPWGFSSQLDGNITVNYETGTVLSLDARFSPFKNGLYLSASYMHISEAQYHMYFERKNESVLIGENYYNTDLNIDWNFRSVNTVAFGLGYNAVFKNGLSFNLGLQIPVISSPYYENIEISPVEMEVIIEASDLESGVEALKRETFYYPVQFVLNVGYNFGGKRE